jgi:Uma2 family endonuclease
MVSNTARPQVPYEDEVDDLTIDYPSSDGEPMAESEWQYTPLTDTVSTLRVRYRERDDVYVAGDMLIYYRMNRNDIRVAPDVFVVFGATGTHPRDSWLVWREGRAPDFVMEIASSSTWRRDATEKRDIYAAMGAKEYVRFDPTGTYFTPALVMETLDGTT